MEDVRVFKADLLASLRNCRKKRFVPEEVKKCFEVLSEGKQNVVFKFIDELVPILYMTDTQKENSKEDVLHNEQLIDVKWSLKYVLQTGQYKEVNVPIVDLQLRIADVDGEVRTEQLNMTLAEFQVIVAV